MQVKLLVGMATPHGVKPMNVGDVIEVSDDEGSRMISSRFALPHTAAKRKAAPAAKPPTETATKAAPRERRGDKAVETPPPAAPATSRKRGLLDRLTNKKA